MERERSCCRGENVIKYPSSWENALASAGLGNGFIPVLPQGGRNRVYRYSRAGAHPRVTSLGLCPIYLLQGHPHPPQCAHWGTFPLEGGRLGGKSGVPPLRRIQKPSLLFVGAGHRPARRCTRRVQEAAPYGSAPAAACSAKPGAAVGPHQQQFWNSQAPVGRIGPQKVTQILRAGNIAKPNKYASPVMGSGESGPMDLGRAKRSRSPSAASPAVFC